MVQGGLQLVAQYASSRARKSVRYGMTTIATLDLEKRALSTVMLIVRVGKYLDG